jgi:hypothetical protein
MIMMMMMNTWKLVAFIITLLRMPVMTYGNTKIVQE